MAVDCYLPPEKVEVIQVIYFSAARGSNTPDDPVRLVNYFFSLDGKMLACYDPINGNPDSFWALPGGSIEGGPEEGNQNVLREMDDAKKVESRESI